MNSRCTGMAREQVRGLLNELRETTTEVQSAIREVSELGTRGWRAASETMGIRTEWRPDEDGSLWVRMDGELRGPQLMHAAAVAHEADLWPRWAPFCGGGEVLQRISPLEIVTYVHADPTSALRHPRLPAHLPVSPLVAGTCSLI